MGHTGYSNGGFDHEVKGYTPQEAEEELKKFLDKGERPFKLISRDEPQQKTFRKSGGDSTIWIIKCRVQPLPQA